MFLHHSHKIVSDDAPLQLLNEVGAAVTCTKNGLILTGSRPAIFTLVPCLSSPGESRVLDWWTSGGFDNVTEGAEKQQMEGLKQAV